jgi:hypothetical protein
MAAHSSTGPELDEGLGSNASLNHCFADALVHKPSLIQQIDTSKSAGFVLNAWNIAQCIKNLAKCAVNYGLDWMCGQCKITSNVIAKGCEFSMHLLTFHAIRCRYWDHGLPLLHRI